MAAGTARTRRPDLAHPRRPQLHRQTDRLPGVAASGQSRYPWDTSGGGGAEDDESGRRDGRRRGGRAPMRASHADREQVIEALKDAFVHGRLTKSELDARAGRALAARTYAELDAVTAGIPPARAASGPARPAGPGPAPAAGQGGRQVGRLPGPRGRRRIGQLHPRSGRPRPRSPLGWPDAHVGPMRHNRGSVHFLVRGNRLRTHTTGPTGDPI